MGFGINKITGSSGLGIDTPGVVKEFNSQATAKGFLYGLAGDEVKDKLFPKPYEPPKSDVPNSAQPVNTKELGNVAYSSQSLYQEGVIPGSIQTEQYKK